MISSRLSWACAPIFMKRRPFPGLSGRAIDPLKVLQGVFVVMRLPIVQALFLAHVADRGREAATIEIGESGRIDDSPTDPWRHGVGRSLKNQIARSEVRVVIKMVLVESRHHSLDEEARIEGKPLYVGQYPL